jgi:prevent-host-death family protein
MREVGIFEARNKLAALLKAVERGEEIMITRRGKPIARLVQPKKEVDQAKAVAAAWRIMELRKSISLGAGNSLKELIDEGRR